MIVAVVTAVARSHERSRLVAVRTLRFLLSFVCLRFFCPQIIVILSWLACATMSLSGRVTVVFRRVLAVVNRVVALVCRVVADVRARPESPTPVLRGGRGGLCSRWVATDY